MRVALHSEIVPGKTGEYVAAHERIPDDLAKRFDELGIHDWVIWRSGDRLFHLVDCDDYERAMAGLRGDPADARWQANIGRYVAGFRDDEGNATGRVLQQVWSLADQRAAG